MDPMTAPPISPAYAQVDLNMWVNQISGDTVTWNSEQGLYLRYDPSVARWSWWGPTRQGTRAWHLYRTQEDVAIARRATVDFWVHLLIGIIIFGWAASSGFAGAGAAVLLFFICTGTIASWLHHRHPLLYTGVALAGWFIAIRRAVRH